MGKRGRCCSWDNCNNLFNKIKKYAPSDHPWCQNVIPVQFTDTDKNPISISKLALWNSINRHLLGGVSLGNICKGFYIR